MRRPLITLCLGAGLMVASACAYGAAPGTNPPTPTPASSPSPSEVWIAIYDVAQDPNDLEEERGQIVEALGDPLEGSVVVSPAGCFDGLPDEFAHGTYVLAIQQVERVYLRALGQQLDGAPRFLGRVTVTCTD